MNIPSCFERIVIPAVNKLCENREKSNRTADSSKKTNKNRKNNK